MDDGHELAEVEEGLEALIAPGEGHVGHPVHQGQKEVVCGELTRGHTCLTLAEEVEVAIGTVIALAVCGGQVWVRATKLVDCLDTV